MDVKEVYKAAGGNYDDAMSRMMKEERMVKFLKMFLRDNSYEQLIAGVEAGDAKLAFSGAHTLKGVAANVGLITLAEQASQITEALRGADTVDAAVPMVDAVKKAYETAKTAIEQLD